MDECKPLIPGFKEKTECAVPVPVCGCVGCNVCEPVIPPVIVDPVVDPALVGR